MFGSHTREQLRASYAQAWHKRQEGSPLTPLETMIADVVGLHPDYQPLLKGADHGSPGENPFLHMGLHMAVREQLSIDRPPGIRDLRARLQGRYGDAHAAEHALMEALAETLWEAQSAGRPPDEVLYLERARRRLGPKG